MTGRGCVSGQEGAQEGRASHHRNAVRRAGYQGLKHLEPSEEEGIGIGPGNDETAWVDGIGNWEQTTLVEEVLSRKLESRQKHG